MKRPNKHFEPIRLELNREASALIVLTTLGCFIVTAAVLLHLFIDVLD